ncbi:hypothetical protein J7399_07565 [Shimia sp. R9_1]|uniref:COG4223 family protein n=1 Tax=Shimia sp. R9_1 TaxID=2821111 RepID=UPI001ADC00AB|nr:hypothetical protein [Shimia sp. R9_1]
MGTTDKSDKPNKDQVEAVEAADTIEDAEIVEEVSEETAAEASEKATEEAAEETTLEETAETAEQISDEDPEEVAEAADGADDMAADATEEEDASEDASDTDLSEDALDSADEPSAQEPEFERVVSEKPEPVAPAPAPQDVRRGGFVPLVFGGVIAAVIGFGGAIYFGDQLGLGGDTKATLAELTAQLEAQNAALAELQGGVSASSAAASGAQGAADAAASALETLRADVGSLSEAVATFEARLMDIEKRPLTEGLGAAAVAAYEREVKDLKDLVAAQKAEAAELKDRADLSAKTALARSSVTRIVAALESGAPYRAAVVDLRSATGQEVAPVLEQFADDGIIPLSALIESYPDAARAALAKARADKVDDAQGSTLGNFFKTQFGARSVEAREGSDTDAILSRAEAALKAGDLATALGEIDTLAEGPKSVMAEWVAQAQTRADATQAAEDLAQTLNSN